MSNEETYKCPKCGCEFENREGEKNVCRCTERNATQQEQPKKESNQSCPCCP